MTIPKGPATTLTSYHGKPVDLVLQQLIQRAELALGFELTIVQGYNPDNFDTSAGTHSFGVVDLAPLRAEEKLHVWCALGGFMWHRDEIDGLWQEHLHGGVRNHPGLSEPARAQQRDFDGTPPRTGLSRHLVDLDVLDYRPATPVEFTYDPDWSPNMPTPTQIQVARNELTEAAVAAGRAINALRDADESRAIARGKRDEIRAHKRGLEQVLAELPPR